MNKKKPLIVLTQSNWFGIWYKYIQINPFLFQNGHATEVTNNPFILCTY